MPPFFKYLWCRLSKSFLEAHLDAGHPGTHPAAQGVREGKDGQGSMGLKKNMYKKSKQKVKKNKQSMGLKRMSRNADKGTLHK